MPLMWREHTLLMQWCLDCHRNPEKHVRPRDAVFDFDWKPSTKTPSGDDLVNAHSIKSETNCSVCHR
jgi:hypothetical protein